MTTKTNKFKKTVAAMMAAGALSSPATAKGITNKFRKSKKSKRKFSRSCYKRGYKKKYTTNLALLGSLCISWCR